MVDVIASCLAYCIASAFSTVLAVVIGGVAFRWLMGLKPDRSKRTGNHREDHLSGDVVFADNEVE